MKGAQQTITNDLTEAAQPAGSAAGKVAGASMSDAIGKKMGLFVDASDLQETIDFWKYHKTFN